MLIALQPGTFLNHDTDEITVTDFINQELILFSMADNVRSIPSIADGLKPGQRKVIWSCFKRKLKSEIKVHAKFMDRKLQGLTLTLDRLPNSLATSRRRPATIMVNKV